jgi:uncharacterized repeat protein (TIGR03803 family)
MFKKILSVMIFCCSLIQSYASNTLTDIHDFNGNPLDGSGPQLNTLLQASNGILYGMTRFGGTTNQGMIYSFDPTNVAGTYANIHNFGSGTDGTLPESSLMQASNGLIYGMTTAGGATTNGMIFSFNPSNPAGTYTNIHNFSGTPSDGKNSFSTLLQASNGLLYGMTNLGGTNNRGVIFSFDPANVAGTYAIIRNFSNSATDGSFPHSSLIQASNGLIYGMASGGAHGNGMIFSFNPANPAGTFVDLHDFGSGTDGSSPFCTLLQASNGLLYGMTLSGGTHAVGMMFSFDPANVAGTYTDIHDFGSGTDGASPFGSLFQASNGLIYGMTTGGGTNSLGIIFSFNPANVVGTYTDIHDFAGGSMDGSGPSGELMQASNGLLYGMTPLGGAHNNGIIFTFTVPLPPTPPPPPPPSVSFQRAFKRPSSSGIYRGR